MKTVLPEYSIAVTGSMYRVYGKICIKNFIEGEGQLINQKNKQVPHRKIYNILCFSNNGKRDLLFVNLKKVYD